MVVGFTGTCVAVGGWPFTVFTVVRRIAEFGDTNRGERCDALGLRGIVSVSVPVGPDIGLFVGPVTGAGVATSDTAEPPPPPLHAAIPLATKRRTEPNATARVFIVMTPLWQRVDARIPRAACGCELSTKKDPWARRAPEQDRAPEAINPSPYRLDTVKKVHGVRPRTSSRSANGPRGSRREPERVMPSDRIDIRHVARLARLALTEEEIATFGPQLGDLMTHVDDLAQLDTKDVAATAQVVPSRNVQRPDALRPETMLSHDAALANAPQRQGPYFRVPRIIAEEG